MTIGVKGDPKVRRDRKCRVCLGERNATARKHEDPFCSADCCRAYHEVAWPKVGAS